MHIDLSKEFTDFINDNVKSGFYRNSAEVVREALRRMRKEILQENYYLRQELNKGLNQLESGDLRSYNKKQIKEEALKKISKSNHLVKDSVK